MKHLSAIAFALGLACLPHAAAATGNLDCSIDDKNLTFEFSSLFGHGVVGPLIEPKASFETANDKVYKTLRKIEMNQSHLKQQWFVGRDAKLLFYAETEGAGVPFASVQLTIEAVQPPDEDIGYDGKYTLVIQPAIVEGNQPELVTLEGAVTCSAG